MTFRQITVRMFQSNYKRYLLYFYCNVFTIAVFETFASIYTNPDFMNETIVNPMISSNIIAPSVFTVAFMFLFIPYSYQAFFRKRKSEYGILLTLGSTEKDVFVNMVCENLAISLLSLLTGLILGTLLSWTFFGLIHHLLNISAVTWQPDFSPYALTAGVYLAIVVATLLLQLLDFAKTQITVLLKTRARGEKQVKSSPLRLCLGCLLLAAAAILMLCCFAWQPSWILLISFALCSAGSWLLIGFGSALERKRTKTVDVGKRFVLHHFGSYRIVTFLAASLFGIAIFLAGISGVTYPNLINNAMSYSPYDLVYVEAGGKNEMPLNEAVNLLAENGVTVTSSTQVPYQRNGAFNLFSVSDVNQLTGSNYSVPAGKYLVLYPYDLNDGYSHEMDITQPIRFKCNTGDLALNYGGQDVKILFNNNNGFADRTLLLNDADYETIEKTTAEYYSGVVKCFTVADWQDTTKGLKALEQTLSNQNHLTDSSEEEYFKISSKLEAYHTAEQSSWFLILTIGFVVTLFCMAANIIIYFKIQSEADDEKRMFRALFRVGVSAEEMRDLLKRKNRRYCLVPLGIGFIGGTFYTFAFSNLNGYGLFGVAVPVAVSAFLLLLQTCVRLGFTRSEEKALGIS